MKNAKTTGNIVKDNPAAAGKLAKHEGSQWFTNPATAIRMLDKKTYPELVEMSKHSQNYPLGLQRAINNILLEFSEDDNLRRVSIYEKLNDRAYGRATQVVEQTNTIQVSAAETKKQVKQELKKYLGGGKQ